MSSRRKHVTNDLLVDIEEPKEGQYIVKVLGARGGNIVQVEFPDGRDTLCLLPSRFNKKVWVKRGGFVLIEEGEGANVEAKVSGSIIAVLYDEHVKQYKKLNVWPDAFTTTKIETQEVEKGMDPELDNSDDELPPLEKNTNRKVIYHDYTDSDSDN